MYSCLSDICLYTYVRTLLNSQSPHPAKRLPDAFGLRPGFEYRHVQHRLRLPANYCYSICSTCVYIIAIIPILATIAIIAIVL